MPKTKKSIIEVSTDFVDEINAEEATLLEDEKEDEVQKTDSDNAAKSKKTKTTKKSVKTEEINKLEELDSPTDGIETSPDIDKDEITSESKKAEAESEIKSESKPEINPEPDLEPEQLKAEKTTKKKGRKITKGDIVEALKEKEELRMRKVIEREEKSFKWHIIQDYLHTKKIARGTVVSVEETTSGMVVAIINFNDFRVVIPASEFFIKPIAVEPNVSDFQKIRRQKQILVKSLGAEVEFVIAHAKQENNKETKQKEYIVLASRKQALLRQIKYYFGKKNGERRIEPGRIIRNVPVIAVGKEALMVSVCGIDKIMNKAQLSYKFLGSLIDEFHVGDRIDVAVLDVIDKEEDNVDIQISHKQTQIEQFKKNIVNCSVGGMYRGIITIVKENTVQLYLTDVDVPAFSKIIKLNNIEELPSAGDMVLLVANKIVPERGLVLGTIIRLIKK